MISHLHVYTNALLNLTVPKKLIKALSHKTGEKTSAIESCTKNSFQEEYKNERVKEFLSDFKERYGIYLSNKDQFIQKAQYEAAHIDKYLKTHPLNEAKQLIKIESGIFFAQNKAPTYDSVIQKYKEYKIKEETLNTFYITKNLTANQAQIISKRIINYEIALAKDVDHFKLKSIAKNLNLKDIDHPYMAQDISNKSLNTQNQRRDIGLEI